jgi:hypothetical protein
MDMMRQQQQMQQPAGLNPMHRMMGAPGANPSPDQIAAMQQMQQMFASQAISTQAGVSSIFAFIGRKVRLMARMAV